MKQTEKDKTQYMLVLDSDVKNEMKRIKEKYGVHWQSLLRSFINAKLKEIEHQQ